MQRSGYTPKQVAFGPRQAEEGTPVAEVCRKMGISEQTFYRWKKRRQGMGVAEVRRLRVVQEEKRKVRQLGRGLQTYSSDRDLPPKSSQFSLTRPTCRCRGKPRWCNGLLSRERRLGWIARRDRAQVATVVRLRRGSEGCAESALVRL